MHSYGKSVVAKKYFRNVKNKIYKYVTKVSKHVYIGKSNDISDRYSSTCRAIKMKLNIKYIYWLWR